MDDNLLQTTTFTTLQDESARDKIRFLKISLITTLAISVTYFFLSKYVMRFKVGELVCLYFIAVHFLLFVLLKLKVQFYIIGNAFSFLVLLGLSIIAIYSGGIEAPVIAWFLCVIVSAFWYANRLSGILWFIITTLDVLFIFITDSLDLLPESQMPEEVYSFYAGVMLMGIMLYYFVVIITYENWKRRAVVKMNEQHKALLANHEELHQQNEEISTQRELLNERSMTLEEVNNKLSGSIQYASRIQQSIMSKEEELKKYFSDAFVYWKPRDIVGGDFYWMCDYGDGVKVLACIDCTGHGVPGSFLTIMANDILNEAAHYLRMSDPRHLIIFLDQNIQRLTSKREKGYVEDGMDISIIRVNENEYEVDFAGAKQNLHRISDGELIEYKGDKFSVGGNSIDNKRFMKQSFGYQKGDLLYLQSDGFQDQFGGKKDKKFLRKRYKNSLIDHHHLPLRTQKEELHKIFTIWKGEGKQTDDVLVVGVKL
ncbi:PP2C family protein-serine/threonine phosphatase [Flammeovirga sp. SJP92]|uniref:PP2C family protein-serine/threonine phosphatase n=1 Tax=Flammeovirga sp. SJP92 TaxID=1775430 RepID=UPI000786CAAE|nr:SpoIIE family protein phosphatase [Flammeovirga sp. SJP92]KXX71918.1 hypothetical protein AVL50_03795 [Flammeovirga sp. SJP92]